MIRKSGSPLPVGSVASQSTSAFAAARRVWLQLPWPSPSVRIADVGCSRSPST